MPLAEVPTVVIPGSQGDFFLAGVRLPITKATPKVSATKSEATGSTDIGSDGRVWSIFGEGKSGWTLGLEGVWRKDTGVSWFDILKGKTYLAVLYIRRPGYNGGGDAGSYLSGNLYIEDKDIDWDPGSGTVPFKISGIGQGELVYVP